MRHLLLVTVENPHDPKSWSGTPYNMLKSLENSFEQVSVLSSPIPKRNFFDAVLRIIFGRSKYPLWMTSTALKAYAKRLDETIRKTRPDAVLCISSQHLVYAGDSGLPVFMISDAPWMAYKQAYRAYEELPLQSSKYARREAEAAKKVTGVIYPTPWACNEAQLLFGITADKVNLVPFGANTYCTSSDEQVLAGIKGKSMEQPRFLFIGKDWERKGGPLALAIVSRLNQRGLGATLHIIGCDPPVGSVNLNQVHLHGYLSPSKPEDCTAMVNAFLQADFFLVPSHAECFGLVFAEAQSYGLPCIALNCHGVPGVVDDKKTGLLFDASTPVEQMSEAIIELIQNRPAYLEMAVAARMKFANELNWTAFGSRLHALVSGQLEV